MRLLVAGAAAAAALVLAACGDAGGTTAGSADQDGATAPSEGAAQQPLQALQPGDPLPDVALPVLGAPEQTLAMGALGGPAILNFWATWCAFCVEEMPDLQAVHAALGDQVRFVGIDREDNVDDALELARRTGVTYELVEDPDGSYFRAVKARGMPTTVFVDADGVIVHRHAGPLTAEQLTDLIEEKLGITA